MPRWRTCGSPISAAASPTRTVQCRASTGLAMSVCVAGERADRDPLIVLAHVAQIVEPADVDEQRRPRDAQAHAAESASGRRPGALRPRRRRAARPPRRPSLRARTRRPRGSRAAPPPPPGPPGRCCGTRCSGRGCPRARARISSSVGSGFSFSSEIAAMHERRACSSRTAARAARGTPAAPGAARRRPRCPRSSSPRSRRPAPRARCTT